MRVDTDTDSLGVLLVTEHAVSYGLAAAGGRIGALDPTSPGLALLTSAVTTHRLRRDQLAADMRARGRQPPQAAPAYVVPAAANVAAALIFAARLEGVTARAYRNSLASLEEPALRRLAAGALVDAARREAGLLLLAGRPATTATTALPGS